MIDPKNITKYDRTDDELEEFAIFAILVAGKNARTVASQLDRLLSSARQRYGNLSPLTLVNSFFNLEAALVHRGIGCQTMKARALRELYAAKLDLRTCTVEDLEKIHGIAEKTSRFFVLHSRPAVRLACLDTHILKWLRTKRCRVPKHRPKGGSYMRLERSFLRFADRLKKTPAELDLQLWVAYSEGNADGVQLAAVAR